MEARYFINYFMFDWSVVINMENIRCPLFNGIAELDSMIKTLNGSERTYEPEQIVLTAGTRVEKVGILMSGGMLAYREMIDGEAQLITVIAPGGVFGEALAASKRESPVTVIAAERSRVLYFEFERLFTALSGDNQVKLLKNLLEMLSNEFFFLHDKLRYMSIHPIRDRIATYLSDCSHGSETVSIPLDRRRMGEFLDINRTALSRELSRMKDDGLIDYKKNNFTLHVKDENI